jgi:hypothetical protein
VNRKPFSRFLFLANEMADEHLDPSDLQHLAGHPMFSERAMASPVDVVHLTQ